MADGCKVERVCERRRLPTLPERLEERRTEAGASLRDLERFFNREVLAAAMRAAGVIRFALISSKRYFRLVNSYIE